MMGGDPLCSMYKVRVVEWICPMGWLENGGAGEPGMKCPECTRRPLLGCVDHFRRCLEAEILRVD